jgi:hypothetical protein
MNELKYFLQDLTELTALPYAKRYRNLVLTEYPFDGQLLTASRLYRQSRKAYLALGGVFHPRLCSTMRALSTQDLFKDAIDFTPAFSEFIWFKDHSRELVDPEAEMQALLRFNEISLYHEQNHRVVWRLLPPAPSGRADLCRYLNFAESLVVTLDLALGDELGLKSSTVFEYMKVIYRPGGKDRWVTKGRAEYRKYLLAVLCGTYYVLEQIHTDDILPAINYLFPGQKKLNKAAVARSLEINELFSRVTNPQWQELNWKNAERKLSRMHAESKEEPLYLPEDPLDLEEELLIAKRVFDFFSL